MTKSVSNWRSWDSVWYNTDMLQLTDEILSEIIWGMENQDASYMLDVSTGTLYSPETGDPETDPENLVALPPWSSSNGYQMMVSFISSCPDGKLKQRLSSELGSRRHGVFRRFRDILSENEDSLKSWFDFKDRRMKAYIRSWYRTRSGEERLEGEPDDEPDFTEGSLLSDFEVRHLDEPDAYCTGLLEKAASDPVLAKVIASFDGKKAFEVVRDGRICGALVYAEVPPYACVLSYFVEEQSRGQGLFGLMFDLFNRDMERHGIRKVHIAFGPDSAFMAKAFSGHDVKLESPVSVRLYDVREWNNMNESAESAYVL